MTRREALFGAGALLRGARQRVIVLMIDGFGPDYLDAGGMPVLSSWRKRGVFKVVPGVMPSVTNANNASICCGCWPEEHGINANFYLDEKTGREEYMESADLVLRPTMFEKARAQGIRSALLSAKKKTVSLLSRGADIAMAAETPPPEWIRRIGPAPHIYSAEINHWLLRAAIWTARNLPEVGILYVHTTDYPMHMWPPEDRRSRQHLAGLDALFGELGAAAPQSAVLLTADHGMHHKTRCWDLEKACAARGVKIRSAISAEQDKYLKHHRGFGGTAWVYLDSPDSASRVAQTIRDLPGVAEVLARQEACRRFRLMPSRAGHLVVLGDRETVFGGLDRETEQLAPEYRSHGGIDEAMVPLVVHNAESAPHPEYFRANVDLARWLFRGA